jgi:LysR substrate binding domain-containing protein
MCRAFGGFEPRMLESPAAASLPLGPDWRPILDGDAIALMPEAAARAALPSGVAAVPLSAPPEFLLALAWRRDNDSPLLRRFAGFVRSELRQ